MAETFFLVCYTKTVIESLAYQLKVM